jgi:DNA-3-methyladenine glycosylase II
MATNRRVTEGIAHVQLAIPALSPYIQTRQRFNLKPQDNEGSRYFESLALSVIGQQISSSAALSISQRVQTSMDGSITPRKVLNRTESELRSLGLSGAKVRTLKELSAAIVSKQIVLADFPNLSDEEVIAQLTPVWGIGRWTAEMFLMFTLGRLDVWPVGDYAVRKGWGIAHSLSETPTEREFREYAQEAAPFRSIAAWYCWRVLEPEEKWS